MMNHHLNTTSANSNNYYHGQQDIHNNKNNKRLRIKSHDEVMTKPKRKRITPYQFSILADLFKDTDTPNYQLREHTAEKLNMTNREVQVWFQNRRAKMNRSKLQEQRRQDPFVYPICWTPSSSSTQQQQQQQPAYKYDYHSNVEYDSHSSVTSYSSSSSSSSSGQSTPTLLPQLSPHMRPLDILALAAEYVQRCDNEKRSAVEDRRWRPWL